MNNIKYTPIPITEKNIKLLETIRFNAYSINQKEFSPEKTYHSNQLRQGKYLVFGCLINNQLIGACYVSTAYNSLHIEQLFIQKEYQNNPSHLGTHLLQYVLKNKQLIEKHFQKQLKYSTLDPNKNTINFYQSLGYQEKEYFMKKRL